MNDCRRLTYLILLFLTAAAVCRAQQYSVAFFRKLDHDVSAFINPVKDLNGNNCALLKIEAPAEFAFSTPLGILQRKDSTGEILLYIPAGSKKLTLKHPRWGIIRNYVFPEKIEALTTYEIRLSIPETLLRGPVRTVRDTVLVAVRDTVTLSVRDTVVVKSRREPVPLSFSAGLSVVFGGRSKTAAPGAIIFIMKRHGCFLHISSDFKGYGQTAGRCGRSGETDFGYPFFSGKTSHSFLLANAGAVHRLSRCVAIFEGAGYGYDRTRWELAPSEGGGWLENDYLSIRGFAFEVGVKLTFGPVDISFSASSIKGKRWYGGIGVGYVFKSSVK